MKKLSAHNNLFEISVRAQSSKQSSLDFLKKEWAFFSKMHNFSFSSIKMPKRISYYNVLRSPHVNKKSREAFECRVNQEYYIFKSLKQDLFKVLFFPLTKALGLDVSLKLRLKVQKI